MEEQRRPVGDLEDDDILSGRGPHLLGSRAGARRADLDAGNDAFPGSERRRRRLPVALRRDDELDASGSGCHRTRVRRSTAFARGTSADPRVNSFGVWLAGMPALMRARRLAWLPANPP